MRRAITVVILSVLFASAISLSASAQPQHTFYLHDGYAFDESAPTAATPQVLRLAEGEYYVWKTGAFATEKIFAAGTWTASLWMNISSAPTQFRVELRVYNQSGGLRERAHAHTPIIESSSAMRYQIAITAASLSVYAGESLALGLLRQWQNGSYSPAAFIFYDSLNAASSLSSPSMTTTATTTITTQTTTQQQTTTTTEHLTSSTTHITTATTTQVGPGPGIGFAFATIAIGVGMASAAGGLAVAATARPYSEVFAYAGYYYCRKHRVPVYYVQGWLWCPVDRRYLRP